MRLNFGEDLFFFFFFFGDHLFWTNKPCETDSRAMKIRVEVVFTFLTLWPDKPCETDSRAMKIRVEVICTFLTLSKKPPPPFSKSWLPEVESLRTSLASRTPLESLALASRPQVLENCPVLGSRTALFFELLKFCEALENFFGKRFFVEIA